MGEHIVELLSTAAPAFERATEIHAMVRHEHRPLPANHQKNHFARRLCIERDMASMVGMELYLHFDSTKMSKSIIKTMINWEYSSKKIKTTIYQDFLIFNHFFYVKKKTDLERNWRKFWQRKPEYLFWLDFLIDSQPKKNHSCSWFRNNWLPTYSLRFGYIQIISLFCICLFSGKFTAYIFTEC